MATPEAAGKLSRLLAEADQAFRAGDLAAAVARAREACRIAPGFRNAWLMRADLARATGDAAELETSLDRAARLTRDPVESLRLRVDQGWALSRLGREGECQVLARGLHDDLPPGADAAPLARLLGSCGLMQEAAPLIARIAATWPDNPENWYNLALARHALGEAEAAAEACERAIAQDPDYIKPHSLLASVKRWSAQDNHLDRLRGLLSRAPGTFERAELGYALFKELDDCDQRDDAWSALAAAAGEARQVFAWSAADEGAAFRRLAEAPQALAAPTRGAHPPRSLFVVGLPRSGTTLVERILAAHRDVQALGELNMFGVLADPEPACKPFPYAGPAALERLSGRSWSQVGRAYRAQAAMLAPGAPVATDKNPQNWILARAIAEALPDVVLVHVRRSPMDSLFGALKQLFLVEYGWSYDLDDLARHYAHYQDLSARWRDRLGDRWIDVSYEALVTSPESVIADLLARCGLDYDPACLSPERAGGSVQTLSALQVRVPINASSVGGWRRYQSQLEPLRRRLTKMGVAAEAGTF